MRSGRRIILCALAAGSILLLTLLLTGCGTMEDSLENRITRIDRQSFTSGSHEREDGYPGAFRTRVLKTPYFTFQGEEGVCPDEEMRALARKSCTDLYTAKLETGKNPEKVTVYVVAATISGRPQSSGKSVFCTPDDVRNGRYYGALLAAGYGLISEWQEVSLTEMVFNADAGDEGLEAYYSDPDHALTLSCAAVYLHPETADGAALEAARKTAYSLGMYIRDRRGFDSFCRAGDPGEYLEGWKARKGLESLPELPAGFDRAVRMRLESSAQYRCVLHEGNLTVNVDNDSWAATADELFSWSCAYYAGTDMLMERIRTDLPDLAEEAENRLRTEPLRIRLTEGMFHVSYADSERKEICLSRCDATWHETMHILLRPDFNASPDLRWQQEGLADRFSLFVQSKLAQRDDISRGLDGYRETFREITGTEEGTDDAVFHRSVWNIYQALKDPEAETYDDLEAYGRAYGICSLLLPDLHREQFRILYDGSVNSKVGEETPDKRLNGNGLNYSESMVMMEYLAGKVGWNQAVINHMSGKSLKEAYGMDYPELFEEMTAYLKTEYGSMISAE